MDHRLPVFGTTPGCDAVHIDNPGDKWMNFTSLSISNVNSAFVMHSANLVNATNITMFNLGGNGVDLDNGASLYLQNSAEENTAGYDALVKSTTGSSTFYSVSNEFGSPIGGVGTGLYIADNASYAEIRQSKMWGLYRNIDTHNSSQTFITGSFLQTATQFNILQNDTSGIEVVSSDGDFSPSQVSVSYPDGLYIHSFSTSDKVMVIGSHIMVIIICSKWIMGWRINRLYLTGPTIMPEPKAYFIQI